MTAVVAWGAKPDTVVAEHEPPRMEFGVRSHDFGDIERKGGDVRHDFEFRNTGGSPLVIVRVVTSCSCVKASYPKRPVDAGQSGVIRITYEPHKAEPGVFNRVVQVYTNAEEPRTLITLKGNSLVEKLPDGKPKNRD